MKKGKKKPSIPLQPGMTMIPGQSYTMPDYSFSLLRDKDFIHPRQKRKLRIATIKERKKRVKNAVARKQR